MVGTPSSSSSSASSCTSFSSFDDVTVKPSGANCIKFLCSYGGKILPRCNDGKLRYFGGDTRVHSVDRSVSFSELQAKMGELCGWGSASIRCQLPNEDLDSLVSITSDEDLANLIEEYDLANRDKLAPLKIRAFLYPPPTSSKPPKAPSPTCSAMTSSPEKGKSRALPPSIANRCVHQISAPSMRSVRDPRFATHHHHHHRHHHPNGGVKNNLCLVHHGNHWN